MTRLAFRSIGPDDFVPAREVADEWMGREVGLVMHRLFFDQLGSSGVWAEADGVLCGFLLGFVSQREPELAYVHFHVVDPSRRRQGIGAALYREFGDRAHERGCARVRALAPLWNTQSIAFHERLGFRGTERRDFVGPGQDRVVFERPLPIEASRQ
jgi:ribosomal protein S18 acetylase RimI-like enzyme